MLADGTNTYAYGLGRIGEQQPGGMVYHLADHLGSVRQLVNASGAVTLARSYDPFGQPLASAGTGVSMYGYTGEQTDASGNVFLRARYYVPGMARFLTRDTYRGDLAQPLTLNRWAYANGNPINMVDPSGHFAFAAAAAACIASAVCAVTVVAAVTVLAVYTAWWLSQPENQQAAGRVFDICVEGWTRTWDNIFAPTREAPEAPTIDDLLGDLFGGKEVVVAPPMGGVGEDADEQVLPAPQPDNRPTPEPTRPGGSDARPRERHIALGLAETRTEPRKPLLVRFHENLVTQLTPQGKDVYMWGSWVDAGLAGVEWGEDPYLSFSIAARNADGIHFNLEGIDDPVEFARTYGSQWPSGTSGGGNLYTAAELRIIMASPDLCAKTEFYLDGSISAIPDAQAKMALCSGR